MALMVVVAPAVRDWVGECCVRGSRLGGRVLRPRFATGWASAASAVRDRAPWPAPHDWAPWPAPHDWAPWPAPHDWAPWPTLMGGTQDGRIGRLDPPAPVPAGPGWPVRRLPCGTTPPLHARPTASRGAARLTFPRRASANFAVCLGAAARRARPCRLGLPSARPSDVPPASISQLRRVSRRGHTSRTAWPGVASGWPGVARRRPAARRLVVHSPGEHWATPERPARVDLLKLRRGRGRSRGG